jgi:hypothetical protein
VTTQNLIIRTGTTFTLVTVDPDRNQCTVDVSGGCGRVFHRGTGERSIKSAAVDCAGISYRTIKALRADTDAECIRRRDLDC